MQKYLILLLVAFIGTFAPASFAADDQPDNPWSQLTEQHPFTVDPSMPHGFLDLPSADTTPFYIRYNKDIYFKIPRNYLLELSNIGYGHSKPEVFFRVEMLYPTFSGATADTLQQSDFRSWSKSKNIIMINGPFRYFAEVNRNIIKRENFAENGKMAYGLMHINHDSVAREHDLYFAKGDKYGDVVIECNKLKDIYAIPTCRVVVDITDELTLLYEYHRDLLPEWKVIHEHVLDFINSSLRKG